MQGDTDQPLTTLSDEELLQRYRGGGADAGGAFEWLIERYRLELFHFLLRFTGQSAAADDLFQETFLQVHLSADTFDPTRRFKPWLFTIAANKARDYFRKRKRQNMLSLSAEVGGRGGGYSGGGASGGGGFGASGGGGSGGGGDGISFVDLLEADVPQPGDRALEQEQRQQVRTAVDNLPDHLREVLILAYFNKLAYRDIAEQLSIPLGTVKSRLHAAVATFAELWSARFSKET